MTANSEWSIKVNEVELGKYVAMNYSRNDTFVKGINNVLPKKLTKHTMRSKDMNRLPTEKDKNGDIEENTEIYSEDEEDLEDKTKTKTKKPKKQWEDAKEKPTPEQTKIMIGLAVKAAIKATMKNHTYEIDNKKRQQSNKGIMGLDLMRPLAKLYMIDWSLKFMKLLKEIQENSKDLNLNLKLECYKVYVDDQNSVQDSTPIGAVYDKNEKKDCY